MIEHNNKQFLYLLRLKPELLNEENWTDEEEKIIEEHFQSLKKLQKEGKLIIAGRTLNMDKTAFGIVIFKAKSEEEARKIMNDDPAVREKIMTATIFPYRVALISNGS